MSEVGLDAEIAELRAEVELERAENQRLRAQLATERASYVERLRATSERLAETSTMHASRVSSAIGALATSTPPSTAVLALLCAAGESIMEASQLAREGGDRATELAIMSVESSLAPVLAVALSLVRASGASSSPSRAGGKR